MQRERERGAARDERRADAETEQRMIARELQRAQQRAACCARTRAYPRRRRGRAPARRGWWRRARGRRGRSSGAVTARPPCAAARSSAATKARSAASPDGLWWGRAPSCFASCVAPTAASYTTPSAEPSAAVCFSPSASTCSTCSKNVVVKRGGLLSVRLGLAIEKGRMGTALVDQLHSLAREHSPESKTNMRSEPASARERTPAVKRGAGRARETHLAFLTFFSLQRAMSGPISMDEPT